MVSWVMLSAKHGVCLVIARKEGRKEMVNLTTHSTHFYIYMTSHSERGNALLPLHGLHFLISSKGSFICTTPDRIAHTTAFSTQVAEHWLEQEIVQWVHNEGSIQRPIASSTELHLSLSSC